MQGEGPVHPKPRWTTIRIALPPNFGNTPRARGENLLKQLEKRGAFFG